MAIIQRRGGTKVNIIVSIACMAVLIVIVQTTLSTEHQRSRVSREEAQIGGIYQSWSVYSNSNNGLLPTPGLVKRKSFNGAIVPGRGEEDPSQNITANLFSLSIMSNSFTPEMCVGATEPSSHVTVCDDYDYEAYKPSAGVFWDANFKADLHATSHVSFAHIPIYGEAKIKVWRETSARGGAAILGNRGPLGGVDDPKSITYRIHPPFDRWLGDICFNDGHTGFYQTYFPKGDNDNVFAWDRGGGADDAFLTFTKQMTETGPVFEHD